GNSKTFANQAGRLKQVSISQWVKLDNFQFASEANKGANSQTFASKLARTAHSFDPMVHRLLIF
ncbi:MAG: hypothetical protein IJR44_00220, partial [Neisseriaceae bacterium]|nr:hypothetical protein [Neisseriaceae bacterium]